MRKVIYVIDPGMMEAGGHHAGLLESLIVAEYSAAMLTIVSHKDIDHTLASALSNTKVELWRHFSTKFYQHYDDGLALKFSGIQRYIRVLAWEYMQVLNRINSECELDTKVVCFYPSLNWEHASALNLAISLFSNDNRHLSHKVCCMFKPNLGSAKSNFHYRTAFVQLAKLKNVKLFASDWETLNYYESLKVPLAGIHPCYLLPWQQIYVRKNSSQDVPKLLLYMGDAKQNKGFLLLPLLVKQILNEFQFKVKLVIHYTLAWEAPDLVKTTQDLEQLAKEYSQLVLISKFWSTKELVQCITECDQIVCSYEPSEYKHKSSGLIWLAAFFQKPVLLRGESWLTRECERLGVPFAIGSSFKNRFQHHSHVFDKNYSKRLFANLLEWLTQ